MKNRTPLADQRQKVDIIEHINDSHQAELASIVADYVDGYSDNLVEALNPQLEDIFVEGCLIITKQNGQRQSYFVPFQLQGDLEEKVLYLAYTAMVKQGKALGGGKKHYFEVLQQQKITDNILRLVLKTQHPLPENAPGFAYLFAQKSLQKAPIKSDSANEAKSSRISLWFSRLLLWVIKKLSGKQRQKLLNSMSKGLRYYTLYQAHRSDNSVGFADIAWVDVFLHGETAGSLWAKNLQQGDIVYSNGEYEEQTDHLHKGQALLLADETSLPALVAILRHWQNPLPPCIVIITAKQSEQDYLPDTELPANSRCQRFVGKQQQLSEDILAYLKSQTDIDTAWGGLEKQVAKTIRYYLRNDRGLSGKNNRVKAYWVDKTEK